jgi:hypothetical protein
MKLPYPTQGWVAKRHPIRMSFCKAVKTTLFAAVKAKSHERHFLRIESTSDFAVA